MNAQEKIVSVSGSRLESIASHDIDTLTRSGERLAAAQHDKMIAAETRAASERAALVDGYRVRLAQLANETKEALRRFDAAEAKRLDNDQRLLAVYQQIRDG